MQSPAVASVPVVKMMSSASDQKNLIASNADDLLAVEQPLEISIVFGEINNRLTKNISVTMRTPGHDAELAVGFLFTEGIITAKEQVQRCLPVENTVMVDLIPGIVFDLKKIERHFYTSSSCGVCGKSSIDAVKNVFNKKINDDPLAIDGALLTTLPGILRKEQELFEHTGGLHASALFDEQGNFLFLREDIGRHNALDKLIGATLLEGRMPLDKQILLLSGRASFELIQKAAMAGIKIICAVGAPSSLAVELAKELNITLIGFLRDGRFNIYSGEKRISK